jgi:hypothetical protein
VIRHHPGTQPNEERDMKSVVTAAAAFCLLAAGVANAQTVHTPTATPGVTPGVTPGASAPRTTGAGSMPMTSSTPMPMAAPMGGPVATTVAPPAPAAAPVTSLATPRTAQTPAAGANSFTEGQARTRITDRGYANVTDLKKDAQGSWRAAAQKDGKPVAVALDFEGNVVAR